MHTVKNYINENKDRFIAELIELLKMPSISADSAYSQDVLNTAEAVKKRLGKGRLRQGGNMRNTRLPYRIWRKKQ